MAALRTLRALPRTFTTPSSRLFSSTPRGQDMARMTLLGKLTAQPETVETNNGQTLFRYSIAVNERSSDKVSFFNIAAFPSAGEDLNSPRLQLLGSLQKGTLLFVEADGKMVTLPPRGDEQIGRKVLNLTQRNFEVLSPKNSPSSLSEDSSS